MRTMYVLSARASPSRIALSGTTKTSPLPSNSPQSTARRSTVSASRTADVPAPLWRPTLEDYIDLASFLLAATPEAIRSLPRIGSAESAIHAPFASFGGQDAYPELLDQAAVLIAHLAQNHPLPDGNKRAHSC